MTTEQTPVQELGYKVGDKFVVVSSLDSAIPLGTILTLLEDDGSNLPKFSDPIGLDHYVWLSYLKPIKESENTSSASYTKSHYDFTYELTEEDIKSGVIKIDPYFVSKAWKLGQKDDSGVLWHCLKTIARFGVKNSKEREIKALYHQIKRLAELEGVSLEDNVND